MEKKQVALRIQISQVEESLLLSIQSYFGGSISFSRDCYHYTASGSEDIIKFVKYLDQFKLVGNKRIDYLIFRSVFVLMQAKGHLTENRR
jgi:hypothetical protein